ncbi:hypothetical protein PanWU01x14_233530 [Parasponia andersonii]|uniref:Transmembrane protein n=1 Tax=Parasponia andersonii TaxID=3476 RepID=A0A2P5BJI1_PARAD|nr:hypothetical protein PanWU01x14_233530 [Parasponia andersonii]
MREGLGFIKKHLLIAFQILTCFSELGWASKQCLGYHPNGPKRSSFWDRTQTEPARSSLDSSPAAPLTSQSSS